MMVLAAGRPGHRFHVLSPAPPRLVNEAGDVRLAEKHDLHGDERKRDELIRLVESLRLEPRHVFRLRLSRPAVSDQSARLRLKCTSRRPSR